MRITIDTPYGSVVSSELSEAECRELRDNITSELEGIRYLSFATDQGPVLIPGGVLRQCLIRFPLIEGASE